MEEFKIGDVVMLKSGEPKMTIGAYSSDTYTFKGENLKLDSALCNWFDGNEPKGKIYLFDQLKKVKTRKSKKEES